MAGKIPTAGTAMCDFPSGRLFPMVSGKTSYPIHPTGRTGFRQHGTFTAGEQPSGIPCIRAGRQHARCSPSTQPVPGTGTLLTTGETTLPRRRAAGRPIRTTFPGQPTHSPQRPEDGRGGYRMLQLRIICSAVLFSTLRSMSSGRLQKKSMPVRPSSSLMLTT